VNEPLLSVEALGVTYRSRRGPVEAVRGVSFACGREKLGIVGESGSGKSTVGRAIMGLLPRGARLRATELAFQGQDLTRCSESQMTSLRGRRIAMILQEPKFALNPVMTIGDQIAEAYRAHHRVSGTAARGHGLEMLAAVHIRNPARMWRAHAHELSGGMAQRAMIAMMLAPGPDLLIADEPTSALDVISRQSVLAILDELVAERGMGLMLISHDLGLVASFCDRVLVMEKGAVVEQLPADRLARARHPYTKALLAARPRLEVEMAARSRNR
jgi:peptide/nickel transport system ATP-binding protein